METSKSAQKKADKLAAKEAKKEASKAALDAQNEAARAILEKQAADLESETHGYLDIFWSTHQNPRSRTFTPIGGLENVSVGDKVWIRARLQDSRIQGKFAFITARNQFDTVQVVFDGTSTFNKDVIKWVGGVPPESIVDILGTTAKPETPIRSTNIQVELHALKIFCVSKSAPELPFQLRDANAPETPESATEAASVGQDVRLDNRILDLRSRGCQAAFRLQSEVGQLFREYLRGQGFVEIHSPKLIGGTSEGGATAFALDYFGRPACLAQSPQLYKQMAVCGDLDRVFEIAPVFRAENSNTHRHLCEFVGLDFEMAFKENWHEILDMVDNTFKNMFKELAVRAKPLMEVIQEQYGVSDFVFAETTPRITYAEGIEMLRAAGVDDIPADTSHYDLSTPNEKKLGQLIKQKYNTDFFIMHKFPLGLRPFYTMPDPTDNRWSNSYDAYMRGEEVVSGAQRIHDPDLLTERAKVAGIDTKTIQFYIDSFKLGAHPHGGAGLGLERIAMLYLGVGNIRKVSLFPRDPKRLNP